MPRIGIQLEEVFAVCEKIVKKGEKPTIARITAITKKGSATTIARHLAEWKKAGESKSKRKKTLEYMDGYNACLKDVKKSLQCLE